MFTHITLYYTTIYAKPRTSVFEFVYFQFHSSNFRRRFFPLSLSKWNYFVAVSHGQPRCAIWTCPVHVARISASVFYDTINKRPQLIPGDPRCHFWVQTSARLIALANTFDPAESRLRGEPIRNSPHLFMSMQTSSEDWKVNWFNSFDKSVIWMNGETAYCVYNPIWKDFVWLQFSTLEKTSWRSAILYSSTHVNWSKCQNWPNDFLRKVKYLK